jgi:hypothetical protein
MLFNVNYSHKPLKLTVVLFLAAMSVVWALSPAALTSARAASLSGVSYSALGDSSHDPTSRGELAKRVANAAGFHEDPGAQFFEDVPPDSPYYRYINRLANRGIISGFPCGTRLDEPCGPDNLPYFRPDDAATWGQAAKVVSEAAGFNDEIPEGQQTFADVPPGSAFYVYVERLAMRGLVQGFPCGGPGEPCDEQNRPYFRPFEPITKFELLRLLQATFHNEGDSEEQ